MDKLNLRPQWLCQQEKDPIRDWLLQYTPVLNLPSQWPDLYLIQHIWDIVDKKKTGKHNISNREIIKTTIKEA